MADCPTIPEESYSLFSQRALGNIFQERVPLIGAIEPTLRCNLRCVHCYCEGHSASEELSTAELRDIIDQIAAAGCMWLLITGGEPLLRADFTEIYMYVKRKGIFPVLFTNGTRITRETTEILSEFPPFSIEISLYGSTPQTYEAITSVPGSFASCMRGIELLLEHDLKPKLKSVVIRENIGDLDAMHALAEEFGLPFRFDSFINATLGSGLAPTRMRIDPEAALELDTKYVRREQAWSDFIGKFGANPPSPTLFTCGAGINAFHIDPNGRMYPCTLARDEFYDLREGSFMDGWQGLIREIRMRPGKEDGCNRCALRSLCGCCPGRAALETGDPHGRIEYMCRVALLRAEAFGDEKTKLAGKALKARLEAPAG